MNVELDNIHNLSFIIQLVSEVKKQSILFSLFSYFGVVIGYINIFLYTTVLSQAEYGLLTFLIMVASLMGILGQAGMPSSIVRFFPHFKEKPNYGNLLSFTMLASFIACTLSLLIIGIFQSPIINVFNEKPESFDLINSYYWLLYALMPFLAFFNLFCSYSFNFQKTAITSFFRDIFIRLATLALLILMYFNFMSFDMFIRCIIFTYWVQTFGMLIYLYRLGKFNIDFNFSAISAKRFSEIMKYSLVTLLTGSTIYLVNYVDQIMVSFFSENQLADGATYRVFFYLGIVIIIPYRALVSSSLSIISAAFKENDMPKIAALYKRTSLLMMGLGVFLFVAIFVNLDNIITLFGEKYADGKYVAVFIGLNALFNIASSVNGVIIAQSPIYRYDLYLNIGLLILNVILNYIFIKMYGLAGAALATALIGILYNTLKILIVKQQFNMQPFQSQTLLIVILGLTTFAANTILPVFSNWFFDAIFRTTVLGIIYGSILIYFNLVPDITRLLKGVLKRFIK